MTDVLILLGSSSDKPVAEKAADVLSTFDLDYEVKVASAHRSPERVVELVETTDADVLVGVAGLSAALPGVIAAHTHKPVIGVPVSGKLNLDSLLSVVQLPPRMPVGAVGLDRGENAALQAVRILALSDASLEKRLHEYIDEQARKVEEDSGNVEDL